MKRLNDFINEDKTSLEKEMELWDKRFKEPFGQTLKELQWTINDQGLYNAEKTEYGFYSFTPFDNYVTAYALDGNKKYTFNHVKEVCDNYDWTQLPPIKKLINKLEKLSK